MRKIETGVFVPAGNHGWIHSTNAPAVEDGSFKRALEITQCAEALGFQFVVSPAIWRGRQGPSRHWMDSIESLTTTAALLQATSRITVFGTLHMTVYHPSIIAKMMTTLDQIGPGRLGMNLVTGSSYLDLSHVGLWRDGLSHDERYDLGDEWVAVVKRLLSEEIVTHRGTFFELDQAMMEPKPSRLPPLVNAGASKRGIEFAARNCDIALVIGGDDPKTLQLFRDAKAIAGAVEQPDLKVYAAVTLIPGNSDEEAQARLDHFNEGVDLPCLEDIARGYNMNPSVKEVSGTAFTGNKEFASVSPGTFVGSYETLARRLSNAVIEGGLDGIMVIVPDYVEDLTGLAKHTFARMADYGIDCQLTVT